MGYNVGYNGQGTFNQSGGTHAAGSIIVGANGTYNYSGGTITGAFQNYGKVNVSGPTPGIMPATPSTFDASVTNNPGGTFNVNQANVAFTNAVLNNAGATFTISQSHVTFNGTVVNNGTWITDPSTIIFKSNFTQNGTITASAGDTFEFTAGTHTFNLGGITTTFGTLILDPGAQVTLTGSGTLSIATLVDPNSQSGSTPDISGFGGSNWTDLFLLTNQSSW